MESSKDNEQQPRNPAVTPHNNTPPNEQHTRMSLSSVVAKKTDKKTGSPKKVEDTLQQKEKRIKELQETIMDKKAENDAIQEAFSRRKDSRSFFEPDEFPEVRLRALGEGCGKIIAQNPALKKALLRCLMSSWRTGKTGKARGVKVVLVWLVACFSKVFGYLSVLHCPK